MTKLCIDCRHHSLQDGHHQCQVSGKTVRSRVDGTEQRVGDGMACADMRSAFSMITVIANGTEYCGPAGELFQGKVEEVA